MYGLSQGGGIRDRASRRGYRNTAVFRCGRAAAVCVDTGSAGAAEGKQKGQTMLKLDKIKMCNCAGCLRELLGLSMRNRVDQVPKAHRREVVACRIGDRPFCASCASAILTERARKVGGVL